MGAGRVSRGGEAALVGVAALCLAVLVTRPLVLSLGWLGASPLALGPTAPSSAST